MILFYSKSNIPTQLISSRSVQVSSFKWTQAHFYLKISADLGDGQRLVMWAHFVQPKGIKAVQAIQPKAQLAKTHQVQPGAFNHLEKQGLSCSWEMGEGLGSHVSAEKSLLVPPSTDEVGGDLLRSVVVGAASNLLVGSLSSGAEKGRGIPAASCV